MEKKIDLHVHTKASDGIYTPIEMIDYAIANGISALAITDHDTVSGLKEAVQYADKIGFDLIPGIELGIDYPSGSFHLLGLYVDYNNANLIEITEKLKRSRLIRIKKMVASLNEYGMDISLDEVEHEASGSAAGKPHIARVMIRKGYAEGIKDVFKNYLMKGKPGFVERERITLNDAVAAIKNAGGIPVVAHPISLNIKNTAKFEEKLDELIAKGIEGVEVYSSMHSMSEVSEFLKIADKKNILISGGSDFHGDKSKQIGVYTDGNFIPSEILEVIKRYRNKS